MLFSSIPFMYYFLPIVLLLYFLVPKVAKNTVLLIFSLVFYAWGEPAYVFLMAGSILMGYVFGLLIEKHNSKLCMIISVAISLGLLGYFKYANFFIENFNAATGLSIGALKIALPIGISFYTFQLVSYLIDVYRKTVPAQRNPITLATYITMFPQLIAGPIVRYADVEKQLVNRSITFDKIAYAIRRFTIGAGKKILIANVLGEFCSNFRATDDKSLVFYWTFAIAVSLQIYFDFSGYSDMAIGLGSILGFKFIENFNYPFISKSITEFWRRWHMSLGSWFRDYVYFPMGGSRCSTGRHIFNLFVVWCLTGFWHGAEWTFVAWGLYFGILIVVEKLFLYKKLNQTRVIGHIYSTIITLFSFIIFDAPTMGNAFKTMGSMIGLGNIPVMSEATLYYLGSYAIMFVIAIIGATPIPKYLLGKVKENAVCEKIIDWAEPVIMIILLMVITGYLVDGSFNPFLYFRF